MAAETGLNNRPAARSKAASALRVLMELGLVERDEQGRLRQGQAVLSTGAQTRGMHIANYHAEMLERAERSMELVPADQRDISSLTFCLGADSLAQVKQRIQRFRRELIELAESEPRPSQVVQLNFQLFPLSRSTAAAAVQAHPSVVKEEPDVE